MIENVRGILSPDFAGYRNYIDERLQKLGYVTAWKLLNAADHGVSQLRPRVVIVALRKQFAAEFAWPEPKKKVPTVGRLLHDLMCERGWRGADEWCAHARAIAPTVVGGSKKHGGPDLGPTRAKKAWAALGVDGMGIANAPPAEDFEGMPRLTVRMVARVQGFPDHWEFWGKKTASYRQVGNAFPPPVAFAVASAISRAIAPKRLKPRARPKAWHVAMI